ncbi:MAG TPA: DsbA family protein [Thermoleophilaceae bacterium]|nr:DsbA family protein [Thermoleophilaceae bacterium]
MLGVTHFTDPGCPWAYSAWPAHTTLRWRYGDQLRWTLVMIGLTEEAAQYAARGYTPTRSAIGYERFRRFGMPFQITPKARLSATSPGCRAVVATRLAAPELELAAFRALQFAQFTTTGTLDDPDMLRSALATVDGLDADAVVERIDDPEVVEAYEADRATARTAAGSPTEFQGRAANTDGAVRYTAPSLVFEADDGQKLEAGGFQPLEAYDVVIANLDPTLERRPPAGDPIEVLSAFPYPLTKAEVAAVMAEHLAVPDLKAAEAALIEATGEGRVSRQPVGEGSLWALGEESRRAG